MPRVSSLRVWAGLKVGSECDPCRGQPDSAPPWVEFLTLCGHWRSCPGVRSPQTQMHTQRCGDQGRGHRGMKKSSVRMCRTCHVCTKLPGHCIPLCSDLAPGSRLASNPEGGSSPEIYKPPLFPSCFLGHWIPESGLQGQSIFASFLAFLWLPPASPGDSAGWTRHRPQGVRAGPTGLSGVCPSRGRSPLSWACATPTGSLNV